MAIMMNLPDPVDFTRLTTLTVAALDAIFNASAKLEYDFLGLESWTFASAVFPGDTFTVNRDIQMLTVGLNYRFGWDTPVTGRY